MSSLSYLVGTDLNSEIIDTRTNKKAKTVVKTIHINLFSDVKFTSKMPNSVHTLTPFSLPNFYLYWCSCRQAYYTKEYLG